MISRTVRYFKLIYIVAGILMSNEEICETVDQIQITPRVEMTPTGIPHLTRRKAQKKISNNSNNSIKTLAAIETIASGNIGMRQIAQVACAQMQQPSVRWFHNFNLSMAIRKSIRFYIQPILSIFSFWTIPKYLMDYSTNLIVRKFSTNSDCDSIYNR